MAIQYLRPRAAQEGDNTNHYINNAPHYGATYGPVVGCSGTNGSFVDGIPVFIPDSSAWSTVDDVTLNTTDSIIGGYLGETTSPSQTFQTYPVNEAYFSTVAPLYEYNQYPNIFSPGALGATMGGGKYKTILLYGINLKRNQIISSAYMQIYIRDWYARFQDGTEIGRIYAMKLNNPIFPSVGTARSFADYPVTGEEETFYGLGVQGETYDSIGVKVNLKFILQEMVNRPSWNYGDAVLLIIDAVDSSFNMDSSPVISITTAPYNITHNTLSPAFESATNVLNHILVNEYGSSACVTLSTNALSVIPQSGYINFNAEVYNDSKYAYVRKARIRFNRPDESRSSDSNDYTFNVPSGLSTTSTSHSLPIYIPYNIQNYGRTAILDIFFTGPSGTISDYEAMSFKLNSLSATIFGNPPVSESCTLFTKVSNPSSQYQTLHTLGSIDQSGSTTLCTISSIIIPKNTTLYTHGPTPYSGNYNPTLYISGPTPYSRNQSPTLHTICYAPSGIAPLYTQGYVDKSSGISLYSKGKIPYDSYNTLYVEGCIPYSDYNTLYIDGPTPYSVDYNPTLYTSGPIPYSGDYNPTLYTHGPTPHSSDYNPTLFLTCRPDDGDMPLHTIAYNTIHTDKRGRHYYPVAFSQTEDNQIFSTYPGQWQNQVGQPDNTLYKDIDEGIDNIDENDYISARSAPMVVAYNEYLGLTYSYSRSETAVIKFGPTVDFAPSSGTMIIRYKSNIDDMIYLYGDGSYLTSKTEIRSLDFPYYPSSYGTDPYNYFPLEEKVSNYSPTYRDPDTFITKEIHWPINSFPDISGYYGKDMTFAVELSQTHYSGTQANGYDMTIATIEIVLYEDVGSIEPTLFLKSDGPDEGIPLYISHADTLDSLPTGLPLFIQGHGADYSGLDLNIIGGMSKSFDLYIRSDPEAYSTSSSGTTLVIWPLGAGGSGTPTGSTTIYTLNYNNESGECPLYISAPQSGTFEYNTPLFLQSTRFYPNNDNISLNVWANGAGGSGYPSYESSLYVYHADISDGYIPLYIPVVASGERDGSFPIHLYNLGDAYSFSPPDLVIWNKTSSGDSKATLFTTSFWSDSSGFPMEILGPPSGGFTDLVPFFSKSVDPIAFADNRKIVPLVILNKLKHGSGIVELSIGNGFPISGNPTLFVEGGGIIDNLDKIDLYINSRISYSGNMPIVTTAGLNNSYHDLYVQAKELTFSSGDSTLFIYSADGSGIYNANDLFMSSAVYGTRTPLFIATHEYGTPNSGFPLYMENQQNSTLGMDIYLESLRSSSNSIKFHTGGEGFIDGASVQRGEIPLYIARPNNADGYSTLLHINGPSGETSGLEMSIMGGTYSVGNVNLTMPTVMGTKNGNMEIYSHGF